MPLGGFDDLIDCISDVGGIDYTVEDIFDALSRAYVKVVIDRESRGDTYRGFTRSEYERNREESDPSARQIEYAMGSWGKAMTLIPRREHSVRKRQDTARAQERFYEIVCDVAKRFDTSPMKVTARMYSEYARGDESIPDWRTFSRIIRGDTKWKSLVTQVCDEAFVSSHRVTHSKR